MMLELRQSSPGQNPAAAGVVLAALVYEFLSQAFQVMVGAAMFAAAASFVKTEVSSPDGATAHPLVAILVDIYYIISTLATALKSKMILTTVVLHLAPKPCSPNTELSSLRDNKEDIFPWPSADESLPIA
jgi:hypothetical protein